MKFLGKIFLNACFSKFLQSSSKFFKTATTYSPNQRIEDVETICNSITKSTEEVTLKTLPRKGKRKIVAFSANSLIKGARKAVSATRNQNQNQTSEASLRNVNRAQRKLDKACANAEAPNIPPAYK